MNNIIEDYEEQQISKEQLPTEIARALSLIADTCARNAPNCQDCMLAEYCGQFHEIRKALDANKVYVPTVNKKIKRTGFIEI